MGISSGGAIYGGRDAIQAAVFGFATVITVDVVRRIRGHVLLADARCRFVFGLLGWAVVVIEGGEGLRRKCRLRERDLKIVVVVV